MSVLDLKTKGIRISVLQWKFLAIRNCPTKLYRLENGGSSVFISQQNIRSRELKIPLIWLWPKQTSPQPKCCGAFWAAIFFSLVPFGEVEKLRFSSPWWIFVSEGNHLQRFPPVISMQSRNQRCRFIPVTLKQPVFNGCFKFQVWFTLPRFSFFPLSPLT